MMARNSQNGQNSTYAPPPQSPPFHPKCTNHTPAGPVWATTLDPGYFDRINHFHITVNMPAPCPRPPPPPGQQFSIQADGLDPSSYDISYRLHALVGKLLLRPRPLSRLEITIKLSSFYTQRPAAIYAAQFLLRPFRRLSNITTPSVTAITMQNLSGSAPPDLDILSTPWLACPDDANLTTFLHSWTSDLKATFPAVGPSPVFEAYWKLEKMVEEISTHYHGFGFTKLAELGEMLRLARVAREDGDQEAFAVTWEAVVGSWCEFVEGERVWKKGVERGIEGIFGVLGRGDRDGYEVGVGGTGWPIASGSGTGKEGNGWVID